MKITDLEGAPLALWVARSIGRKEAFYWTSPDGKVEVYLRSTDQQPFMPHEEWRDCGAIIPTLLAAGCVIMQVSAAELPLAAGPFGRFEGKTVLEAICRARVALHYGAEVSCALIS